MSFHATSVPIFKLFPDELTQNGILSMAGDNGDGISAACVGVIHTKNQNGKVWNIHEQGPFVDFKRFAVAHMSQKQQAAHGYFQISFGENKYLCSHLKRETSFAIRFQLETDSILILINSLLEVRRIDCCHAKSAQPANPVSHLACTLPFRLIMQSHQAANNLKLDEEEGRNEGMEKKLSRPIFRWHAEWRSLQYCTHLIALFSVHCRAFLYSFRKFTCLRCVTRFACSKVEVRSHQLMHMHCRLGLAIVGHVVPVHFNANSSSSNGTPRLIRESQRT